MKRVKMGKGKRVLVFGTFDGLHEGHLFFLSEAKKYGDRLYVVVALDETVRRLKRREPVFFQDARKEALEKNSAVYRAVLGRANDKYSVIEEIFPDVICLGYDQTAFVDALPSELAKRGLAPTIIRIGAFQPHRYKSTLLREKK